VTACPDLRATLAHRFEPAADEPVGWDALVAHLDGCSACRERALALDPTLLFTGLRRDPVAPGEIETVRDSVRIMRRMGRARGHRRFSWRAAGRAAAVLLLPAVGLILSLQLLPAPGGDGQAPPVTTGAALLGDLLVPASELPAPPFVEALDRPQARVYQLGQEDLSVVMIVDENLDV